LARAACDTPAGTRLHEALQVRPLVELACTAGEPGKARQHAARSRRLSLCAFRHVPFGRLTRQLTFTNILPGSGDVK
jgi:hypothetical protein